MTKVTFFGFKITRWLIIFNFIPEIIMKAMIGSKCQKLLTILKSKIQIWCKNMKMENWKKSRQFSQCALVGRWSRSSEKCIKASPINCFHILEILERSRLIYSDVLFTLLCSSPARESFQNNPRWQHCCFSYYCLALSLSILQEGLQSSWFFDFAHILGKNDKKR